MAAVLKSRVLETPLGPMIAVSDEDGLYLLEFVDSQRVHQKLVKLQKALQTSLTAGTTSPLALIETELRAYFKGSVKIFKTPLHLRGTPFQLKVWEGLRALPYGCTQSYAIQAKHMGSELAYRAVANANAMNHIAIVIPCHRVISSNGEVGGYGGGSSRKSWLLAHEKAWHTS